MSSAEIELIRNLVVMVSNVVLATVIAIVLIKRADKNNIKKSYMIEGMIFGMALEIVASSVVYAFVSGNWVFMPTLMILGLGLGANVERANKKKK